MKQELYDQIEQLQGQGEHEEIITLISNLPEGERDTQAVSLLARAYNNTEEYGEAEKLLLSIREESENDPLWHLRLGYAYYYQSKLEEAKEAFTRACELDPEDEVSAYYLDLCESGIMPEDEISDEDFDPEVYEEEEMEAVETHIETFFGEFENVFHEIASPDIHVDIYIIEPTPERNYYTLVTSGMGAHRMNTPEELASYKLERAEVLICLPPEWNIQSSEEKDYWPLRWLKVLARLPISNDTWLGWGHTVPNGEPFAENTKLSGVMLIDPCNVPEDAAVCQLPNGEEVNFYQVIPVYEEEMNFKLANGAEKLLEKLDDSALVLDINRPNVCADFVS